MKPAFTFEEIREVEKTIIEKDGIPSLLLMENAGKNAYRAIRDNFPDIAKYRVYIFCGKGNNAGDGFVVARQMIIDGINIFIIADISQLKGDALVNYNALLETPGLNGKKESLLLSFNKIDFTSGENPKLKSKGKVLIIDAILGTGIKGKLSAEFESAINHINTLKKHNKKVKVVSIDVPSGLMSGEQLNPVVNADFTITMGAVKTELLYGQGKESCGEISVVAIGDDHILLEKYNSYGKYDIEPKDVKKAFPVRKKTSYKYSNGKVLIIGGSRGLSGAVIMSSLSALKSGAGAVYAAIPESINAHFSRKLYEVIKIPLDETTGGLIAKNSYDKIQKVIEKADSVLIGPGLSLNSETKDFLFEVIKKCPKNMVIDADGLSLLAEDTSVLLNRDSDSEIILTPHIGEFSRLSKIDTKDIILNRFEAVRNFALKYNVNIVMKSETTFSCFYKPVNASKKAGDIFFNPTGNECLASAGSGDVLSGIITSLLAQSGDVFSAAVCGSYIHGLTADLYYEKSGNKQSALQKDLIKLIPKAITHILN